MGAWGYGLFQSDAECDLIKQLDHEAGKLANDPNFTFNPSTTWDEVVAKLDVGLFHQLLERFKAKHWDHGIIYLGVLSMHLGVKIDSEEMQLLRDTLPQTKMYDEARAEMQKALDGYKSNGESWHFESMNLEDTIYFTGMGKGLPEDPDKMPTPMPMDEEREGSEAWETEEEQGEEVANKRKRNEMTGEDELASEAKGKVLLRSKE